MGRRPQRGDRITGTFAALGLPLPLVQSLAKAKQPAPFPIQAAAIPLALAGRDILGKAPTGSGKTLAFGLPMLALLTRAASAPHRPRGLVLAPTRELADQIVAALDGHAAAAGLRLAAVTGGVPPEPQVAALRRAPDIVVATPGRLLDLARRGAVDLSAVRVAVLDEADQMAELGFADQVRAVWDRTPAGAQRMLFSATLDDTVQALVDRYLRGAAVCEDTTARPDHRHYVFLVDKARFDAVLTRVAARDGRTLVFTPTKALAGRLADTLRAAGVAADALHSDLPQARRTAALQRFRDGVTRVLVTTDVAARGIDVAGVDLVVHAHPPRDATAYTHRAGRTARAGASGTVVTIATPADRAGAEELLRQAGLAAKVVAVGPHDGLLARVTGARTPPGAGSAAPTAPAPAPHSPSHRPRGPRRINATKGKTTPIATARGARPMRGGAG